jgi:hypothetical protein
LYFIASYLGDAFPLIIPLAVIGSFALTIYSVAASKLKETEA